MPDVHVPKLDEHDEEPTAPVPAPVSTSHHRSTVHMTSWTKDLDGAMRSVLNYMGDASYVDPRLLTSYEEVLQRIDRALGESPAKELR